MCVAARSAGRFSREIMKINYRMIVFCFFINIENKEKRERERENKHSRHTNEEERKRINETARIRFDLLKYTHTRTQHREKIC